MRPEMIEAEILAALADMPVIDAHERLMLEKKRVVRTKRYKFIWNSGT